jgi:DNA polymerase III delta prime subunit
MTAKWLEALEQARAENTPGVVLVFNTTDRVYIPETGLPVMTLKYFLAEYLARQGLAVGGFSLAEGLQVLRLPPGVDRSPFDEIPRASADPVPILRALTRLLQSDNQKVAIVIDHADHLVPNAPGMTAVMQPGQICALEVLHAWGLDDAIRRSGNLVVLLSHENQVHDLLTGVGAGYRVVQVDLPDQRERYSFIARLLELRRGQGATRLGGLEDELTAQELARITSGLRLRDIEELFRWAGASGEAVSRRLVRDKKARAIRQICGDLLEVFEPAHGLSDVAGLPHVVDYCRQLKWRIQAGDPGVPQALLFQGVPGVGKSYSVLALAHELGYPCLAMRSIRERWVGASERNLERVLWVVDTLAPCLVWIDEVDQALGQRTTGQSADAGTSERILARIWEFMGSSARRGRVLWVATTNRPDLLDAATLDRFQVTLPFLHPTPSQVEALLPVLAAQIGRRLADDVRARDLVARMPAAGYLTVRMLQEVVATAGAWADHDAGQVGAPIDHAHLEAAMRDFKPNCHLLHHQLIALIAVRMTSFQSLLPWRCRDGRRPDVEIPSYLADLVDAATGEVDSHRLDQRITELEQTLFADRLRRMG